MTGVRRAPDSAATPLVWAARSERAVPLTHHPYQFGLARAFLQFRPRLAFSFPRTRAIAGRCAPLLPRRSWPAPQIRRAEPPHAAAESIVRQKIANDAPFLPSLPGEIFAHTDSSDL